MKFFIPEEIKNQDEANISSREVLIDSEEFLLLYDKISDSELISRNILYQRFNDGRYRKTSIVCDISTEWNFQLIEQEYKVLNDTFGLVESERGNIFYTYSKEDIQDAVVFPLSKNVFEVLRTIQTKKNIKPTYETIEGYFREPGDYGVDNVICEDYENYPVSSMRIDLDGVVKERKNSSKSK